MFAGVLGLYEIELTAGGGPDVHSSRVAEVPEPAIDLAKAVARDQGGGAGRQRHVDGRRHARGRQPHGGRRARRAPGSTCGSPTRTGCSTRARRGPRRRAVRAQGHLPAGARRSRRVPARALAEALRRHGTEPRVVPRAPWWAPYHVFGGVPFASGGPGSAGGAHGPDEWAEVAGTSAAHARDVRRAGAAVRLRYEEHTWPELQGARRPRRPRRRHPHRHTRGPWVPPPRRHRRPPGERDLRARGPGRRRPGAAVPDPGPRLHAAPHGLPRQRHAALERLRGDPRRPGPQPLPPRVRPHPVRQRPRLQPAAGGHRRAADRRRVPRRGLRLVLLPAEPRGQARDRRGARLGAPRRDGARVRARDLDLPRARARARADGQGGQGDPGLGLRARVARLVRRPAPGVAALVGAEPQRRGGRRDCGHRGQGRAVAFRRGR